MVMPPAHPTHRYFLWLALLLIALALLGFGFSLLSRAPVETNSAPAGFPVEAPPPKAQDYVAAQKGFQYLVSYSENGFMPATLSVQKGETVRFTNNSDGLLRLLFENAQITSLNRGEYYEYTFANAGAFAYSDGTSEMTVTVK